MYSLPERSRQKKRPHRLSTSRSCQREDSVKEPAAGLTVRPPKPFEEGGR